MGRGEKKVKDDWRKRKRGEKSRRCRAEKKAKEEKREKEEGEGKSGQEMHSISAGGFHRDLAILLNWLSLISSSFHQRPRSLKDVKRRREGKARQAGENHVQSSHSLSMLDRLCGLGGDVRGLLGVTKSF